ncbi:hypothetical protein TNCV_127291 [Trichonephila clavipes]|nr:hypothetical protein TNCV_127291 [Trichonephila clavipes]
MEEAFSMIRRRMVLYNKTLCSLLNASLLLGEIKRFIVLLIPAAFWWANGYSSCYIAATDYSKQQKRRLATTYFKYRPNFASEISKIRKTPIPLACPILLSKELMAVDDNVCTDPIIADKDILEFVQSSKDIIAADCDDENEMNNAAYVPITSEMRNVMKDSHSNGEINNKMDDIEHCQVIYSQFGLEIHQNDHQAKHRFVEWAQNKIAVVPDFHKRILFSHEAHFWLNGYNNKQNCRIWSEANPQVYVETPLHPEKLTVWCALWAGGILLQKR